MRTQWTAKENRDAGSSCSCDRGLRRYLRNFGGGLNTPNPPSRYATDVHVWGSHSGVNGSCCGFWCFACWMVPDILQEHIDFFFMYQVNKDEECLPMPEFFTRPCGWCFSTLMPLHLPWQGLAVAGHQQSLQHWTQATITKMGAAFTMLLAVWHSNTPRPPQ